MSELWTFKAGSSGGMALRTAGIVNNLKLNKKIPVPKIATDARPKDCLSGLVQKTEMKKMLGNNVSITPVP